jgi:hypothetical protein
VAQHGVLATGEHGSQQPTVAGKDPVAYGIDALMDSMEATVGDALLDRPPPQPNAAN